MPVKNPVVATAVEPFLPGTLVKFTGFPPGQGWLYSITTYDSMFDNSHLIYFPVNVGDIGMIVEHRAVYAF